MAQMQIRAALLTDSSQITRLWKEMWDLHQGLDPDRYRITPLAGQVIGKWMEENIKAERSLLLVAEEKGALCGYMLAMIQENPPVVPDQFSGYISELAVQKEYRGNGLGKKLLDETKKWFRTNGVPHMEMHVSAKNAAAVRFWKREGFSDYLLRLRCTL